ncbi:TRAP transporter small permease [Aquicoccus sp. G2-2]|uniref:TRAP transporter small permease n=1 Tax=Aquicoccus sp. G2-2 TaxID=3092120 RepID=UPI002AE08935|nr:TRAP transporter small permease [Aquicoccus sp. G2-2]MEA1112263.1 TRAP transporter small permease [Aquicoccus sp. G2-2]
MWVHRLMMSLARLMAILGGVVLVALVLLICVSVLGRGINTFLHWDEMQAFMPLLSERLLATGVGPILGDYELVQAGIAFSIFAFMPLCQITAGHASVDIFTAKLPRQVNRFIQLVVEIAFAAVLVLIAWRLFAGMEAKRGYNETSFLLQFPIWWAYGLSFVASVMAAIVGVYMAFVRIVEFAVRRTIIESAEVEL